MWYPWIALLVSCALVVAEVTDVPEVTDGPVATTRAPPRTLDRQPGELVWRNWFQNPEDGSQNAPPRRITTKSLFITPLVCPKGHRLDGSACVQVVTVNKDEHERILLHQLNALFTSSPNNGDVVYDYGDEDPGPLQLSIPIGIDPLQDQSAQAQDPQSNYVKLDKKGENSDADVEAELELLKLQQANAKVNNTHDGSNIMSHNVLHNLLTYSDKPKRDSPMINSSETESVNNTDEGQKELVFGHVNVDPVLYDTDDHNNQGIINDYDTEKPNEPHVNVQNDASSVTNTTDRLNSTSNATAPISKKDTEDAKLNPENDYSDIGEAIKLISRYAEVSTDDNFTKDDKKIPPAEDSVLGTRTKLQYRRNKPKLTTRLKVTPNSGVTLNSNGVNNERFQIKNIMYYRYPSPGESESSGSLPSNYPFRHLQDYWPGRNQIGGVYNTMHENPRRHHHSYPHYFRPRGYQYMGYTDPTSGLQEAYYRLQRYPHKIVRHNTSPIRSHANNQDLYSLLGLRHWFSSEGATKR